MDSRNSLLQAIAWITLFLTIFISWAVLSLFYQNLIPSPYKVYVFLTTIPINVLYSSILRTLYNSLMGFFIALLLTILSVFLAYLNSFLKMFFNAVNTFIQSISVLVWTLILIMIFGILSPIPPVLVTTAATYPLLLSSMFGAVEALDKKLKELSKLLGASKLQSFVSIILPGGVLYMAGASRAAIGLALRISVVAEAFGGGGGIGYRLIYNYDMGVPEGVFAWALLLISIMILLDHIVLKPIEGWTRKWLI